MSFANGFIEIEDPVNSTSPGPVLSGSSSSMMTPPTQESSKTNPASSSRLRHEYTIDSSTLDLTESPPATMTDDDDIIVEDDRKSSRSSGSFNHPSSPSSSSQATQGVALAGSGFGGDNRYRRRNIQPAASVAGASNMAQPMTNPIGNGSISEKSNASSASAKAKTSDNSSSSIAADPSSLDVPQTATVSSSFITSSPRMLSPSGFGSFAQQQALQSGRSSTLPNSFAPSSASSSPLPSFADLGNPASIQQKPFASQRLPGQVASPFKPPILTASPKSTSASLPAPRNAVAGPSGSRSLSSGGSGSSSSKHSSTDSLKAYYRMQSANVNAARQNQIVTGAASPHASNRPAPTGRSGTYPGFEKAMVALQDARSAVVSADPGIDHPEQPRATTTSTSSSIKNGRTAITFATSPKPGMIDLTNDDAHSDPDEIIVDDRPVCIGQITTLALILYVVAELQPPPAAVDNKGQPVPLNQQLPFANPAPSPLPVYTFRGALQQGHETLKLVSPKKKETFGVVEHRVADVIGPLLGDGWHGTGYTEQNKKAKLWCEAVVVRKNEKSPTLLPLHLLLYAKPEDVPSIASLFSRNTIYLEHVPNWDPSRHGGFRYSNPHNTGVTGRTGAMLEQRRQQLLTGMYGANGLGAQRIVGAGSTSQRDEARSQVDEVFKSLKSALDLEEVEPPPMVTTKLYPHQKQALSFLLDREAIHPIPEKDKPGEPTIISLWSRESDPYGRPIGWKSVVADLMINGPEPPPQTRGAILADDMGLGKTIAIIALVATTLEDATNWARKKSDKQKIDPRIDALSSKAKQSASSGLGISDFSSRAFGHVDVLEGSSSNGRPLSKKKLAALKREQKREDARDARYDRLVTKSRATLIVCPLSTVQNWESQFDEHTGYKDGRIYRVIPKAPKIEDFDDDMGSDGSEEYKPRSRRGVYDGKGKEDEGRAIKVYVYHGNQRIQDPHRLADFDVVITTFSTLGTEYSKQTRAEDERAEDAERAASREGSSDEALEVFAFGPNGEPVETTKDDPIVKAGRPVKPRRKRRRVEGDGASPLQQIEWYRVVLDEAHIIKEHTTIQARAACELATPRRIALSGTPLQNSLNDLFSLVRFLRLEPFTDRAVWNQHIGSLAKAGLALGVDRLQLIMRHLALRRTKESTDKDGKPILSLPPNNSSIVELELSADEKAFYQAHHQKYKHDFEQLEQTDSVMKNYCSILQELLRLRQICVHPALVRDSEDAKATGEGVDDIVESIKKLGISKQRAIPLLVLMRDNGAGQCSECGTEMLPVGGNGGGNDERDGDVLEETTKKAPAKKSRKMTTSTSVSAANSETDEGQMNSNGELRSVVTKCQHLFCRECFIHHVYDKWVHPRSQDTAICSACQEVIKPALDAVEIGACEFERATDKTDEDGDIKPKGRRGGNKGATRVFEHSSKSLALVHDLIPFSQANPASVNFRPDLYNDVSPQEGESKTIGFQPIKGEVVKSVVFSQWTKYLDRLGDALDSEKIKYGRLDGTMDRDARSRAMDAFKTEPSCEVLLVSLRAGGVGLNLTAGRRVYLMEPFWNPAVENQAVDRIHRLGQTMPVQTVRFIIKTSIEENMRKIQKRKMDLANMSVKKTLSKADLLQQRKEELAILMSS